MSVKERLQYVWTPEEEEGIALPLTFPPVNEEGIMLRSRLDRYEVYYLTRDEYPQSPDEWGDDNLFLVHYHRDFDVRRDDIITEKDAREWYQRGSIDQGGHYWIFPVAAYIHSGVVLHLGDGRRFPDYQWDVSHVGLVLVSKIEWATEETARVAAEALITEWNLYLSGDVYCTVVEQFDGAFVPVDCDIVCGFYGEDYAKEELASMAGPS